MVAAAAPVDILVVEDRADSRAALRAMLSSREYRLVEASSGPEALRKLLADDFAVLLIDVVMPGMSGFELAAAVRGRQRTASVPIIFMSGEASDVAFVYEGYQAGAVDYLVKPLVPDVVRAKVAVFVELHRQRKQIEQQAALLMDAERQRNELRLAELRLASERRYSRLAETVPDVIWTAGADGRVEYFNRRWFQYTGLSAEQSASGWRTAVHPEDEPRSGAAWSESARTGQPYEQQVRLRASDGSYRWHLVRAVAERGMSGEIVSWLGTLTDIEHQKDAERVLAEFKGTLDAVLDAVLIFDPDSLLLQYVNRGASLLTGHAAAELLVMRPFELMIDYDEPRFRELLAPLQGGSKTVVSVESRWRRKGALDVPVDASFQLVRVDGSHVVSIARDVTERKLAELEREQLYDEAVAAIRMRDEFLSIASHELKTPITSLQLQLEMLTRPRKAQEPLAPERVQERLAMAKRQVCRLTRLVAELMDVSRIAGGRLHLDLAEVDLSSIVRDVIARLSQDAERAGTLVDLNAGERVLGRWDALRMEQVVTNLLTNALKFGAGKPVDVTVSREGAVARLTVRDQGIGIRPEDVERIFQCFERAASARSYGGLGLGLYIVRQIVEAHGGEVHVESEPGAGAIFCVELPVERAPRAEEERPTHSVPTGERP